MGYASKLSNEQGGLLKASYRHQIHSGRRIAGETTALFVRLQISETATQKVSPMTSSAKEKTAIKAMTTEERVHITDTHEVKTICNTSD